MCNFATDIRNTYVGWPLVADSKTWSVVSEGGVCWSVIRGPFHVACNHLWVTPYPSSLLQTAGLCVHEGPLTKVARDYWALLLFSTICCLIASNVFALEVTIPRSRLGRLLVTLGVTRVDQN